MLKRNCFITNSSSTGFIGWGVVMPKAKDSDYLDTLPEVDGEDISIRWVSHDQRAVCIHSSMTGFYSGDYEEGCVDEGVYPLEEDGYGEWEAKCTTTITFRPKLPPNKDYAEWERALNSFLKTHGLFDLATYMPKWIHVRSYD